MYRIRATLKLLIRQREIRKSYFYKKRNEVSDKIYTEIKYIYGYIL